MPCLRVGWSATPTLNVFRGPAGSGRAIESGPSGSDPGRLRRFLFRNSRARRVDKGAQGAQ
jgi:hypothetical protein